MKLKAHLTYQFIFSKFLSIKIRRTLYGIQYVYVWDVESGNLKKLGSRLKEINFSVLMRSFDYVQMLRPQKS